MIRTKDMCGGLINEFGQYVPDTRDGEYLLYVINSRIPYIGGVV